LGRDGERDRVQVDANHAVNQWHEKHEARPRDRQQPSESEDDAAFVLAQHA
jgi:hypothetical protein